MELCSATVTNTTSFYVYNSGGTTYANAITSTCTKVAPTCTEASTAAINCMDAQMNAAAGIWKKGVRDTNSPEQEINWID